MKKEVYRRYNSSAKGQARRRHYEESHPHRKTAKYFRDSYHELQELIGTHHDPGVILPAHRLLKALETAEVVEI